MAGVRVESEKIIEPYFDVGVVSWIRIWPSEDPIRYLIATRLTISCNGGVEVFVEDFGKFTLPRDDIIPSNWVVERWRN